MLAIELPHRDNRHLVWAEITVHPDERRRGHGTAMLADAVPLAARARTQGSVDLTIALAGASGGMASGFVVASTSYAALSLVGGVLALAIVPLVALGAREAARP